MRKESTNNIFKSNTFCIFYEYIFHEVVTLICFTIKEEKILLLESMQGPRQ